MEDGKALLYRARIQASVTIDIHGCWIWQKTKSRNGYGTFAYGGGRNARAHRVSYEAYNGPIKSGHDVCHRCDVRACVNPKHLFLGTRSENILDASAKNRVSRTHQKKGADHPSAKLNDTKVREILALLGTGIPKTHIARQFGVSDLTVHHIASGKTWRHVARPA